MMGYEGLTLQEWIEQGRQNGAIQDVVTVIYAYWMEDADALDWIAPIVTGEISENEALAELHPVMVDNELVAWR
jgi:hypothetical protein